MDLMQGDTPKPRTTEPAAPAAPVSDVPRLERIRRKKRMRRIRRTVICVVLLAGIMAYFAGLYGASLALLGDVFDSVSIALTPGQSYPAALNVPGFTQARTLAGGFAAVGEQDLVIQSARGAVVRRIQHGYARPCITTGNNRVCIYNRAGTGLRVESRSRTLFENQFENPILLCAMSPNGSLAVFTKSRLLVYDPMFVDVFDFYTSDLPTAMAFASDNRQVALGCPYAEGGALGGTVYLLNTGSDKPQATIRNTEGVPLQIQYLSRQSVLVIYDTFAAVYDTATGTQQARYSYGGQTLQSAAVSGGKNAVLLFGDGVHSALTNLVVLDANLAVAGAAQVNANAESVAASRTGAYVLTRESVLSYGLDGSFRGEEITESQPLTVLDARKVLLLTDKTVSELSAAGMA